MTSIPHPALDISTHFLPSLRTFWPSFTAHFFRSSSPLTFRTLSTHPALQWSTYRSFYTAGAGAGADPIHSAILICAAISIYCWGMCELTGNASQVDGLWTFLPVIYTAHFTFHKYATARGAEPAKLSLFGVKQPSVWDSVEPRMALILGLQVLWSVRLTFNAWRRGMFKPGEEDYRWPLLRQKMSWFTWKIFNFSFIAIAQNILLAITALPSYLLLTSTSVKHRTNPVPRPVSTFCTGDYILAGLFILNLTLQFIADQQQWNYQNFKRGLDSNGRPLKNADHHRLNVTAGKTTQRLEGTSAERVVSTREQGEGLAGPYTPADRDRGFVTKGLWAFSRHPNFACEQTTWWILYAFVPLTFLPNHPTSPIWHYLLTYALASPLSMNALFIASTLFSEGVSAGKYPAYEDYQKRVAMFWPLETGLRSAAFWTVVPKGTAQRVWENVWGTPVDTARKVQ